MYPVTLLFPDGAFFLYHELPQQAPQAPVDRKLTELALRLPFEASQVWVHVVTVRPCDES